MKKSKLEHIKLKENKFNTPENYFGTVEDAVFTTLAEAKLPTKSGFKTHKDYFKDVEDNVLQKLTNEKLTQETGYKTSDGYFDTIEDKVLNKIKQQQKQVKVIDLKSVILKKIVPIAAAASLAIIIYLNYQTPTTGIDEVASSDIEQWIQNDLLILDSYEIAEAYNDVDLEDENSVNAEDEEFLEYIDGTDIESLLLEN